MQLSQNIFFSDWTILFTIFEIRFVLKYVFNSIQYSEPFNYYGIPCIVYTFFSRILFPTLEESWRTYRLLTVIFCSVQIPEQIYVWHKLERLYTYTYAPKSESKWLNGDPFQCYLPLNWRIGLSLVETKIFLWLLQIYLTESIWFIFPNCRIYEFANWILFGCQRIKCFPKCDLLCKYMYCRIVCYLIYRQIRKSAGRKWMIC